MSRFIVIDLPGNNPPRRLACDIIDLELGNDLDGFVAFSNWIWGIQWPATFKPVGIDKFNGELDPKTLLRTYSIAV